MKKYFAFLLSATAAMTANAGQISEQQAAAIASKYMPETTTARKMARAKSADNAAADTAPYYVFNFGDNQGFVVISGDDSLTELIGYSREGSFSTENMPQNLKSWFGAYADYVEKVQSGEATPIKRASEVGTPVVDALVKTHWNQDEPFNRMCPAYYIEENEILPTGCVATAVAQVMNYYEYPSRGKGEISYSYYQANVPASRTDISVDFSQSTYDWDNMLDDYTRYYDANKNIINEYNDTEAEAVALLMRDCGASVLMTYALDGSGALDFNIPYGIATHFGYKSSLYIRSAMTDAQFIGIIEDELDNGRPLVFCGSGTAGGHCFVADGYDSNGLLHINWGWGGLSDGWFDINLMNPDTIGIGGGAGGFVEGQSVTTMQPDESGDGWYGNTPLAYTYDNTYRDYVRADKESLTKGDKLTVEVSGIANYAYSGYNGSIAVAVFDRQGNRVAEPTDAHSIQFREMEGVFKLSFNVQGELENLADGEYMIYPVSKETRTGEFFDWMRVADADRVYITVEGNEITVGEPIRQIAIESIDAPATAVLGNTLTANFVISNNTTETATGSFDIIVRETSTGSPKMKKTVSFTARSGSETTVTSAISLNSLFESGVSYTATIENVKFSGLPFEMEISNPSFSFTVTDQAGVNGISNDDIKLYPNPVADILKVDAPEQVTAIQVFGSDGRLAKSATGTDSIDLSSCPAGYYIVVVTTGDSTIRQPIVKK
ncbi:MAG TPA: thiol protease/hemagglutinin PrtT [Candidatus Limisoma gallistercoris]|nr:thiol protease/hemagglutinin PrtT [Candidatus Limisoma gallistercoris]